MIQLIRTASSSPLSYFRLNIYDKATSVDYKPLITFTSQLTGKSKTFVSTLNATTNKDRYVELGCMVTYQDSETLTAGIIYLGNTDFPLGFYDVTIYQNSSNTNLDPSGLTTIYTGLMNLTSTTGTEAVKYSEYTTNDSDTESVYITI